MKQYLDFLQHILDKGQKKEDRTGTGTISTFGYQMRFDLSEGFPLLTTKRVYLKAIIHELLWFISGDTNIKYLVDNDVKIWNDWPYEKYQKSSEYLGETIAEFVHKIKIDDGFSKKWGELGPVYGYQWRHFESKDNEVDQLEKVIKQIKENPDSRRHIVNAWQAASIEDMALPPCHLMFQFYVSDNKLSLQLYQRSADAFLGVPFNIASYSLLLMMVAKICDLEVGEFIHTLGDCHIYINHLDQVKTQLSRDVRSLPKMEILRDVNDIDNFIYDDFKLSGYKPHNRIVAEISV